MSNVVAMIERPSLRNPVLIEGLPGIGFVANIVALHLIGELKAKKFCEVYSSDFQAFALIGEGGFARPPMNELYYCENPSLLHDLIVLYGNTQALSSLGQYELCEQILDLAETLGCRLIITVGGLRRDYVPAAPKLYVAATDVETLSETTALGANVIQGRIFGAAGLLIGLAKLRKMKGFCLLSETSGFYPDPHAAKVALAFLAKFLKLDINLSRLNSAVEATERMLSHFAPTERRRKPEFPRFI